MAVGGCPPCGSVRQQIVDTLSATPAAGRPNPLDVALRLRGHTLADEKRGTQAEHARETKNRYRTASNGLPMWSGARNGTQEGERKGVILGVREGPVRRVLPAIMLLAGAGVRRMARVSSGRRPLVFVRETRTDLHRAVVVD